jgi:hypothetical protein
LSFIYQADAQVAIATVSIVSTHANDSKRRIRMLLKQQRKITFLTERARRDLFDFAAGSYAANNAKS